jgi:hypothetical protein
MIEEFLQKTYFGVISFLYSIILAGSILGVVGLYKFPFVLMIVIFCTPMIYFLIFRSRENIEFHSRELKKTPRIFSSDNFIYYFSFVIILLLILVPIIRWPNSFAGDWFPWDAGKYHFPKAVEMVQSGSANDMTIAYSEYPFGYESLLSFCILLTGDTVLFGWMHAIINVFFILSFWLLARRVTKINSSTLLFIVTLLILSNYFFQIFNLWQVFQPEVTTVGKNDLFLAASLLAVIYLFPHPRIIQSSDRIYSQIGIVGMISLSIKPNAIFILAPLWIFLGIEILANAVKNGFETQKLTITTFIFSSFLMLPGMAWLFRNLVITKNIFSDYVLVASEWSMAANLTNPFFYNYISKNLWFIVILLVLMVYLSINHAKYRWVSRIFLLLFIGFIFTPVSAFFLRTDVPATINWRFGEAMLVYVFIVILLLTSEMVLKINWVKKHRSLFAKMRVPIFFVISVALIWSQAYILQKKPENKIILKDQFRDSVGVNGYHSVYDYVQKNVRNSVVWVENGLPFYAYGPDFSNSVSRQTSADYIIVIKTDWFGDGGLQIPRYFDPEHWEDIYSIEYEDSQGIIFSLIK